MLVVVKNTEEALLKELKIRALTDPVCRCLYWRASLLGDKREQWLSLLLEKLENTLLSDPGQAYLCHDGDVFIIARTLTHKTMSSLLTYLSHKIRPAPSLEGLAYLFEIGIDVERLMALCRVKIENRQALEEKNSKEKKEKFASIEREKILQEINPEMVSNLHKRRNERQEPEIMIAEDDAFSQKLVNNALGNKYRLNISSDGQGAIMSYVAKAPDVLFLDIGLPDIDGHRVLEEIFKIDPQAYVVMFSGNGSKENIMRAIELGAKGFIGKPFTKEKLFQYIEKSPFIQTKQTKEKAHGHPIH